MLMIISRPASGMLNWLEVAAITTSEARGTPATPLEVTINIASMANCVPSVISMPQDWAMKMQAKISLVADAES